MCQVHTGAYVHRAWKTEITAHQVYIKHSIPPGFVGEAFDLHRRDMYGKLPVLLVRHKLLHATSFYTNNLIR